MAKIKKGGFADMLAELQAAKVSSPAPVEVIPERRYFLIVCEGEKTEPLYFEHLRRKLPKDLLETIEIQGEGDNTLRVVQAAIRKRDERLANITAPDFDEVWAVFDKDDFPEHRYDNAVQLAAQSGVRSAHSNQCFELWYVLHFQYLDTAITRQQYFDILSGILGFKYAKNSSKVVQHVTANGNVEQAIKWAEQLDNQHGNNPPSGCWPHTKVYELVKNLIDYVRGE